MGMKRREQAGASRKSLTGASENGLREVRRRKSLVSGRVAGQSLGRDAGGGADPGEMVRSVWSSSRRRWRHVVTARAGQEGAQPCGGAAGTLLSQDRRVDAAGLHEASAYHQFPPAELVFLQPGLHSKVHACMCLCNLVIEEPSGDEREVKEGKGQETERGRRWKRPV